MPVDNNSSNASDTPKKKRGRPPKALSSSKPELKPEPKLEPKPEPKSELKPKPTPPEKPQIPLGRAGTGKYKNLTEPPIRRSRIPANMITPAGSTLVTPLDPGQVDLTPEQARSIAAKLGVRLPKDFEKLLVGSGNGNGAKRTVEEALAGAPVEHHGIENALQSRDRAFTNPAIIRSKAERDRIKLGMLLPYTSGGFATFYDAMYHSRGFRLERHLLHIVHGLLDDRIKKLLVTIGPGSGKSALLSTVYPAFRLGTDPAYTILGISAGEALMQGFQAAVMDWIEFSPQWKAFFPNVRPDKNKGWSTERGMFVKGHPDGDPDASYLACGLTSKRLTGVHARLILGDDLHDEENSSSAESCEGVITTFYRQIMGRADPRGARFVFAGRRWHENDLYNHLMLTGEWVVMNLPALRDRGVTDGRLYWDITIPDGLECCFTEIMRGEAPSNLGDDVMKLPTE